MRVTKLTISFIVIVYFCACNNEKTNVTEADQHNDTSGIANNKEELKICIDRLPCEFPNPDGSKPAGGLNSKVWKGLPINSQGRQIITVRFLEGSDYVKSKVIKYAKQWEPIANIEFRFADILSDTNSHPDIKISFKGGDGSWSFIGNDSKFYSPSMNFGWFDSSTPEEEFSRVILHEFGHALSLIHEHQNPKDNPTRWNKDEVYKYFTGSPNFWSRKEIDENLFKKYAIDQINGSSFDSHSIMLYGIPGKLTQDGRGTKHNTKLSELDKKVVRDLYRKK